MMSVQELATACQNDLTLTVIAVNNARLGTIRAHQERNFPGRVSATELTNPDFCALARSFGATAVRADSTAEFRQSLARARARGGVNLIEVLQDRSVLAPGLRME